MDPQVQASFIPKKPLMVSSPTSHRSIGIVWLLSLLLLILSIAGAAAAFGYQTYLQNKIKTDGESLTRAQAAYDPAVIESLIRLDSRIQKASGLLKNHLSPSVIFTLLENNTLSTVRFTGFEYNLNSSGVAALTLSGEGLDFASVALQADAFSASKTLKNVLFSDITVDPATSHIMFKVQATIDPSLLLFSNSLTAQKTTTTRPQTQGAGAATSGATSTASTTKSSTPKTGAGTSSTTPNSLLQ